jgi:hypothetical protein
MRRSGWVQSRSIVIGLLSVMRAFEHRMSLKKVLRKG